MSRAGREGAMAMLALAIVACGGPSSDEPSGAPAPARAVEPAPAPAPPPRPPAPQPMARVEADALVLHDGSGEARVALEPGAQALLVDLDTRGERGVWVVSPSGASQLSRIASGPALVPFTSGPLVSPPSFGSGPSLSLVDLDGDGRHDVWSCTTRASDIGPRTSCSALRRTDAGFEHDEALLRASRRQRRSVALERALAAAGAGENVVARAPLGVVRLTPRRGGFEGDAQASAGEVEALLTTDAEPGRGLRLVIARSRPEPIVLATSDAGELHEAFTDDACRERFRLGAPMVRVADASPDGRVRALVVTRTEGARRVARISTWDGATLAPRGEWIEVDRCDTEARDVRVRLTSEGATLDVAPLPPGVTAWL